MGLINDAYSRGQASALESVGGVDISMEKQAFIGSAIKGAWKGGKWAGNKLGLWGSRTSRVAPGKVSDKMMNRLQIFGKVKPRSVGNKQTTFTLGDKGQVLRTRNMGWTALSGKQKLGLGAGVGTLGVGAGVGNIVGRVDKMNTQARAFQPGMRRPQMNPYARRGY